MADVPGSWCSSNPHMHSEICSRFGESEAFNVGCSGRAEAKWHGVGPGYCAHLCNEHATAARQQGWAVKPLNASALSAFEQKRVYRGFTTSQWAFYLFIAMLVAAVYFGS